MRKLERKPVVDDGDVDVGLGKDEYRDRPRKTSRHGVAAQIHNALLAMGAAYEALSEAHHELDVGAREEVRKRRIEEPE